MSRMGYKVVGWSMIVTAVVLFVGLTIYRSVSGIVVNSEIGRYLNVILFAIGLAMLWIARNEKKFKEQKRNEDERFIAIQGKVSAISLFAILISYFVVVIIILTLAQDVASWIKVLLGMPPIVALVAESISTAIISKRM